LFSLGLLRDVKLLVCLSIAIGFTAPALAQDRVTPETGILGEESAYHRAIRAVFAETFRSDIVLQAIFVPSFEPEAVAGIRKTSRGFEAFASRSSHIIGQIYEAAILKKGTPDLHQVTVQTKTHAISAALTQRIQRVWKDMLLAARHSKSTVIGFDGMDVHFSMPVQGRGIISGKVWSPERGKTAALEDLAEVLGDYAEGKADEKKLEKAVKRLEG
jgi:hypothetical protein